MTEDNINRVCPCCNTPVRIDNQGIKFCEDCTYGKLKYIQTQIEHEFDKLDRLIKSDKTLLTNITRMYNVPYTQMGMSDKMKIINTILGIMYATIEDVRNNLE